jgi:L-lactate dehydrogenase
VKVGIVGSGLVGATAGYALLMWGVGREVVLAERNRARAEADDIHHAVPFAHPLDVRAGVYEDLKGWETTPDELARAGTAQEPALPARGVT